MGAMGAPNPLGPNFFLLLITAVSLIVGGLIFGQISLMCALIARTGPERGQRSSGAIYLGAIASSLGYVLVILTRGGKYEDSAFLVFLPPIIMGSAAMILGLPKIRIIHLMELILGVAVLCGTIVMMRG